MIPITKERDDARNEVKESQQSAMNMFNEQTRHESQIDRMKDEVSRANKAMDKMRDEMVRLRSKVNDLRDEKSDLKKEHEHLRSLLDRRNQQLNVMEQSVGTIEEDRTRIQLHSTEARVTIVSLRRELEEARAGAHDGRAASTEPDDRHSLGKLATHDALKTTHLTKTAPIFTFLYRATVFCQTAPILPSFYRNLRK